MANQEQLDMLKQDVKVWNEWRARNSNIVVDLRDADLGDANLDTANLRDLKTQ